MSSGSAGPSSSLTRGFAWPWIKPLSPLASRLLSNPSPEVELSDYRQLPSSGTESPSSLLNGDSSSPDLIPDLDVFFVRLYEYYCERGLRCIIAKWAIEILNVAFMVFFIGFFLLYVDWDALLLMKCGVEAIESGAKPCDLAKEVVKSNPLVPFTFSRMVVAGSMLMLSVYGILNFLKFFVHFGSIQKVRNFYHHSLGVSDSEIHTMAWPAVLEKVVRLQRTQRLCVVRDLTEHDIVMRIMRKENYLIGMVNKGILAFPIPSWIPGVGPPVRTGNHLVLPKTLEWTLNWCIFHCMFDSKFCVRKDFLTRPMLLRRRLLSTGIGMLLVSPCLVIFMFVYHFLRRAEQFYNQPYTAFSRRWSNLSRWLLREFNEVEHLFKHRMNSSSIHASNYLKQFPAPLFSIAAKFVSFVSSGLAGVLVFVTFLDESLLEGHIFGRNLLWYTAVFGTVAVASRAVVPDELPVSDPEGALALVVQQTHHMPKHWRNRESSNLVRGQFETLFQYTGVMLVEEIASILITPYLLICVMPRHVDEILHFIMDFTTYVDGVGDVCSLSLFDFEMHGNQRYGSPLDAPKPMRSSQGKMEKSFLSFQSTYASWEPGPHGRGFVSGLREFRDRQLRNVAHGDESPRYLSLRRPFRRFVQAKKAPCHVEEVGFRAAGHNLGSLWLLDSPPLLVHPYLLDWYYATWPHRSDEESDDNGGASSSLVELPEVSGDWKIDIPERIGSHMEASGSSRFLLGDCREDVELHGGVGTRWWARQAQPEAGSLSSFIEPPQFGRQSWSLNQSSISKEGPPWEGDPLARKEYAGYFDDKEGSSSFHFADASITPGASPASPLLPAGLQVRIIPRSSDPV